MSGTSSGTTPVEIIQTVPRKRWTSEQKLRMVEETFQPGNSVSRVARENGISPAMLYKWRRLMQAGGATAVVADDQVVSMGEVKALHKRIKQLERALGRKTLENDILKAAVERVYQYLCKSSFG